MMEVLVMWVSLSVLAAAQTPKPVAATISATTIANELVRIAPLPPQLGAGAVLAM